MKLRTRIFLLFSATAILPLLILTLFSYQRYVQNTYQRMDEFSAHLAENASKASAENLESIQDISYAFNMYYNDGSSVLRELEQYTDKENRPGSYQYYESYNTLGRTCRNLLLSDSHLFGIYIFTPSGYVFDYTSGENGTVLNGHSFEDDDWYKETVSLNGKYFTSAVRNHEFFTGSRRSVFFSKVLKDVYSHKFMGVLLVDCNPSMFDLSSVNNMPEITLISIENADTQDVIYTNYADGVHDFDGKNVRVTRTDLPLSPLRQTITIDYSSLFREFNVTGIMLILIGSILAAAALISAFVISGRIVRPVEHLSRKMASQKGHTLISSTSYLDRSDEIGILYNGYNSMVESLNTAVKQDYQDKLVLLDSQMRSLEARINSHFLFNTLEAINSMAELDDNEPIATMSLALGNMFRYALKTQSELVTVQEELDHVKDYVTIQLLRFDNRFRLELDMTEEFRQLRILKLILQPLVENSLYHGLKQCTAGDVIRISGKVEDSCLLIDVHDNGCGINAETLEDLRQSLLEEPSFTELGHRNRQSIGLKNIHSRIELYYGRGYGLTVTSEEGAWTNIRIRVPRLQK